MSSTEFQDRFGGNAGNQIVGGEKKAVPQIRLKNEVKMSKPEIAYGHILRREFPGCDVKFAPLQLRLESGNKYTPDWIVFRGSEIVLVVEVKGGYRLQSAARSAAVFKEAAAEYKAWRFRHARLLDGSWTVVE